MIPEKVVRVSLGATFIFNLAAAALLVWDDSPLSRLAGITPSHSVIHTALAAMMVAALGLAYGWLALRPRIDRVLLTFGGLIKGTAFVSFALLAVLGAVPVAFALFATPDILFALLWFVWLRQPQEA